MCLKVPSRSLPRSQNNSVRSGRRSVEPAAVVGNTRTPDDQSRPVVVHSVPPSRTTSITSLTVGSDVSASRGDSARKSSSGNRIPAPTSLNKMKTKTSRDNLVPPSKTSSTVKTSSASSTLPKSRCQSAPRTPLAAAAVTSPVVADGNQVATKSQVATVRQLSVETDGDRVPSSAMATPRDDITIPSDITSRRPASGSRMPRLTSSSTAVRPSTSRSVGSRDSSTTSELCDAAQLAGTSCPNGSHVIGTAPTSSSTVRSSSDVINNSMERKTDGENTLTRASKTDSGATDDFTCIKPMKPMTSLSYLFTSTPLDVAHSSSCSTRLLSANRRPFPSVSLAPTGSRAAGTLCSGYVSDGDMTGRNCYNRYSGYMSEGGVTLYATRRTQRSFMESIDGMRQCLERGLADVDDDDVDDDDFRY